MGGHSRALLTIPKSWFGGLFAAAILFACCLAGAAGWPSRAWESSRVKPARLVDGRHP